MFGINKSERKATKAGGVKRANKGRERGLPSILKRPKKIPYIWKI